MDGYSQLDGSSSHVERKSKLAKGKYPTEPISGLPFLRCLLVSRLGVRVRLVLGIESVCSPGHMQALVKLVVTCSDSEPAGCYLAADGLPFEFVCCD